MDSNGAAADVLKIYTFADDRLVIEGDAAENERNDNDDALIIQSRRGVNNSKVEARDLLKVRNAAAVEDEEMLANQQQF